MALISGTSRGAGKAVLLIFAVSMLGILRFGVAALKRASSDCWILLGCLLSASAWIAAHPSHEHVYTLIERLSEALAACAAILTADAVLRIRESESDWPRLMSLGFSIVVLAFAHFWREEVYTRSWVLPCYGVAFAMQIALRLGLRLLPKKKKPHPRERE